MLHAVIMAGGSGTRFWPESRGSRPKQLLPITGGDSMLAETVSRLDPLVPLERTWIVTNAQQVEGVLAACPGIPKQNVLIEPCARNTAPCVGLAAAVIHAQDPDAVMAVLPADHSISPNQEFQRSLRAGAEAASESGVFITFGIPPTYPATGYGYIQSSTLAGTHEGLECFTVDSFREKPDKETAEAFLAAGGYFWNAGIFVWSTATILDAIRTHASELMAGLDKILPAIGTENFQSVVNEVYPSLPSDPVDVAIMEKVDGVQVLATPYRWSDVGSWKALYDEVEHDEKGNVGIFASGGTLMAEDSQGILAYSSEPQVIAVLGMEDIVVVRTADAILVAPRDRSEEVKRFVTRLKEEGRSELL